MPKSNSKDKVVAAAAKAAAKTATKKINKEKTKNNKIRKEVKKEVNKEVKKSVRKFEGPKPAYKVSVTATLGHITGNREHGPELKMSVFLHPGLVKGPDDGTEFGPLQAAAAQYGLWRCTSANVIMTPLVGPNAVSGTVERFSVNLTQSPSSTNWGGLGARKHFDVQAGVRGSMRLGKRDLAGPRDGGWWLTDTNAEGAQSAGPLFEVHGLGETTSTYQGTQWEKELYIVELRGTWEFANYSANPALGSLDRVEEKASVTLAAASTGEIEMTVSGPPSLMRLLDDPTVEKATATTPSKPGEIIYQVVDTAAGLASTLAPPPFGWLIKGGWWFLKKIFGAANDNTTAKFLVYPSLADAQNNRPAISTNPGHARTTSVETILQVTQLNSPNMGGPNAGTNVMYTTPMPLAPTYPPSAGPVILKCFANKVFRYQQGGTTNLFSFPPIFVANGLKRGTTFYKAVHLQATGVVAAQLDVDNNLTAYGHITPQAPSPYQIPSNLISVTHDINIRPKATYDRQVSDTSSGPDVWLHAILWTPQDADKDLTWTAPQAVECGYLRSEPQSQASHVWEYKCEQRNLNPQINVGQVKLGDSDWLTLWFTKTQNGGDLNWASDKWVPNNTITELLGVCFMGGNVTQFNLSAYMTIPQRKLTKLEKLAAAIGVSLDDLESDSGSELEPETASEGDLTDSESISETSFDVVPVSSKADSYLRLKEQGLTHSQILEVLSLEDPAV